MGKDEKKVSLGSLFLVTFIDLVGIGIIIPILPLIFFETSALPADTAYATKTIMLGLLLSSFPIMQFFGAPLLGAFADKYGRKPILQFTIMGACIGYALFAVGIMISNVALLFFSRMLSGFCAGNLAIVKSIIADISDEKSKVKNFGLIGMSFGLGFILGPFLGGILSDPSTVSWFSLATPLWAASLLSLINVIYVQAFLRETLEKPSEIRITLLTGIKNVKKAFTLPNLRLLFLAYFLFMFGFTFFTQFFSVYAYERFAWGSKEIGYIFGYVGIWIAFAQGFFSRWLSKYAAPETLVKYSLFFLGVTLLALLFPTKGAYLYVIFPFIALCNGVNMPNFSALFSNSASKQAQGEILGIEQSVVSLALIFPPIISGIVAAAHPSLPIVLGAGFVFIGWWIFILFAKGKSEKFTAQ
jgi:MFS transporter, DHA1 family, tetracycline resistance protein